MVEWYGQKLSSLVSQASNSDMIDAEVVLTCRESEFIPANNIIMHIWQLFSLTVSYNP